ncbi:MAG TPA: ribosome biogenesis GTPase Der [Actinomycetota bacterium]|nr:ribosome biogenesis GTPase Der [Actinomycetota bacterium]
MSESPAAGARVPRVAVIGRQNVGKSTLVNRLFGRRESIAHDDPGVTRDRVELEAAWRGRRFTVVDTAGYMDDAGGVEALARDQADRAMDRADLILLVVDARAGVTEQDGALAKRLRRAVVPVVLVANKVDTAQEEPDVAAFHSLGLGDPFPVSAMHGRAAGDLLDRIVELLPDAPREVEASESLEPVFALVGRPNVGKSSVFNRLAGEERSVVFEEAGTTRDAVDAVVAWPDGHVRFVDTAGMRRATRVRGIEYFSVVRATQAIERAHVAMLVIDASQGFTVEDKRIANIVIDAGRGLLLVANKWDLVEEKDDTFAELTRTARQFASAPVMRTSATGGRGVHRLPPVLLDLHARWTTRVPTSKVNEVVQQAQRQRPTPRSAGTLHYVTQVSSGPPSFVIFGGATEPDPAYRRYIENRLRRAFRLEGVPVRVRYRSRRRRPRATR